MDEYEINIDETMASILSAIANAEDNVRLLAEVGQVDPDEFRRFMADTGQSDNINALEILEAAEALSAAPHSSFEFNSLPISKDARILVIDEPPLTDLLRQRLVNEGYTVDAASSGAEALELFGRGGHHLAICDLHLPDADGMEILRRIKNVRPLTEVIVVTGSVTLEQTIDAIKAGAYWLLEKPLDFEVLLPLVERALERHELMTETQAGVRLLSPRSEYYNLIGISQRMRQIYERIALVARSDASVLILGESGTGKELAARALHQNSPRGERPFVVINCAVLTETLLESELFGHERGAFTGALAQKKGKLEVADGGTLFLDEVGELAPALQAKLLRVLQEREFERLGGTKSMRVDVRLIAATNLNLEEAVRRGIFRRDLYYRLNVVTIEMPALRDRREDIPLLADYFVAKYAAKTKGKVKGLAPATLEILTSYSWPGNVRELENTIERACILGATERVMPEDLPESILEAAVTAPPVTNYHDAVRETKKQVILLALEQSDGDFNEAARSLGIHPSNLHRLVRNLNLHPESKE